MIKIGMTREEKIKWLNDLSMGKVSVDDLKPKKLEMGTGSDGCFNGEFWINGKEVNPAAWVAEWERQGKPDFPEEEYV